MSVVSTNFLGHFQVHGTCFLSQTCTWNKLKQKRKIALSAVSPEKKRKLLLAFTYTAPWNFLINVCQVNKHINPTVSQGDSKWFCCQTPIFFDELILSQWRIKPQTFGFRAPMLKPLSNCRDFTVSEVYHEVHMTRVLHTVRISNVDSVMFANRIREILSFELGKV